MFEVRRYRGVFTIDSSCTIVLLGLPGQMFDAADAVMTGNQWVRGRDQTPNGVLRSLVRAMNCEHSGPLLRIYQIMVGIYGFGMEEVRHYFH
jgi:hypothetical protein